MNNKLMKLAGIILPLAGAVIGLATNFVDDKKLDEKVAKKVAEAITNGKES